MVHQLPLDLTEPSNVVVFPPRKGADRAAIEEDEFPFEEFCGVAELESWRKEINRPLYHVHKWWAQRLGSVFRAIIMSTLAPAGTDVKRGFYRPIRFPDAVVFDPFMGSGTTIGEALKLGCRVVGRDINPVAYFAVKNALSFHPRAEVIREFKAIERDIAAQVQYFYQARLPEGGEAQSLYYFWVKTLDCPYCSGAVDLFSSYIFARHAYPKKHPAAQTVCPSCYDVSETRYDAAQVTCASCNHVYDPRSAPAKGPRATCTHCGNAFAIARTVREVGHPPKHRLYAKLVLTANKEKRYLPVDHFDHALYQEAATALAAKGNDYPEGQLQAGYNTNQAINLSCGDSGRTDLASGSVDAVITDPPFFDNVHYSQLADFFHVWQQYILLPAGQRSLTTRSDREVQQTDAKAFTTRLQAVWRECQRVLKREGLLVFSYHHSRPEGWHSIFEALTGSGFVIVSAHPIKAEMSVAMPKKQAKAPIDLDIILVCRKREDVQTGALLHEDAWERGVEVASNQIERLRRVGRHLSRNDIRVIVTAQIVRFLSTSEDPQAAYEFLGRQDDRIDTAISFLELNPMVEFR